MLKIYIISILCSLFIHSILLLNNKQINTSSQPIGNMKLRQGVAYIKSPKFKEPIKVKSNTRKINKTQKKKNIPFYTGVISLEKGTSLRVKYPYLSQLNEEEDIIKVKIFLNKKGKLENIIFLKKSKYERLNNEVLNTLHKAKFSASKIGRKFVSSVGIKEFVFKLK